ncbi:TadE/TadG family type IV pilus assembly protein [Fundidesulfovibrio terrae]|uniref:TadE/TadG family type IV pilus assembly protein n=1 Tax=Fundidesulfovibrio terrae TaxID=2922866 RepID=UPI001FB02DCC|nr:TadE/TadG family type IV pilus assembly protein [Fundidesulfovibrio terrae]
MKPRTPSDAGENGTALLEFVVMALFILGPLTAMIIDFGQILNVNNVITRAAEEGALAAGNAKPPGPVVSSAISGAKLDAAKATTTVSAGAVGGAQGSLVSVTVAYDLSGLCFFPWPDFILSLTSVTATSTVRHF